MNFITEHGIDAYGDLESKIAKLGSGHDGVAAALKGAEAPPCGQSAADEARHDVPADKAGGRRLQTGKGQARSRVSMRAP